MGCTKSKPKRARLNKAMQIIGSHTEHHLDLKQQEKASNVVVKVGSEQLKKQYIVDHHVLGKGQYGKVYKATDRINKEFQVAIKVLDKRKMSQIDLGKVMDEVDLLKKVDHPNIVEYFETYDDKNYLYLVMELCTGGELFDDHINCFKSGNPYTEQKAAQIIKKCLQALHHCHLNGITHRDIKPENIMIGNDGEVRLVDFGLAKDTKHHMKAFAGTPYFMAPEVLNGDYTHKCDIWSIGCVLFMLMVGDLPFQGRTRDDVYENIRAGNYLPINHLSEELQSLLGQMFTLNYKNRPTALECQTHVWFNKILEEKDNQDDQALSQDVLTGLQSFHGRNRLRRECLNILVKMVDPKEFVSLRKEFNKIDTSGSGTIDLDSLRQAVRKCHVEMTEVQLEEIIADVDLNGNGLINYHEFIAATFPIDKYATRSRLESLFQKFNMNNEKQVTKTNLRDAFTKLGHKMSSIEIAEIMDEHKVDHDHVMTYEDFSKMILDHM